MSAPAGTKVQQMRAARVAEARRSRQRQRLLKILGSLVILSLVVAIVVAVVSAAGSNGNTAQGTGEVVAPRNVDGAAIPVGNADAPVTVEVFYDYMCPYCGAFEAANRADLERLIEDGTVRLDLRPLSFLDEQSAGTEYSTRAANAIATTADGAPQAVLAFHAGLYAEQPHEGAEGLTDDRIADIATAAGVPQSVVDRFDDRRHAGWVAKVTEDAFSSGISGTPTVKINGTVFEGNLYAPGPLADAIAASAEGKR